jgi:hypothetical protein
MKQFHTITITILEKKLLISNFKQASTFIIQFNTNISCLFKIIARLMDNYKQFKFFQNKVKQFQYNFSDCLKRNAIFKQFNFKIV